MIKVEDFVFETFLRLTSKTVPYGSEDILVESMRELFPKGMQKDEWGNYFYKVGDSRSIFAAHLDTVSKDYVTVTHVFDGNLIKTDGKTTLGADDKAGITILLWMIQNNVPGLYYFFIGEEVGCIGSGNAAKFGFFKGSYDRIISFDRRDVGSVITFQSSSRCCSDDFADVLCRELNQTRRLSYKKDTGGVYTDSAEFTHLVPECTNVSVGYYKEHTTNESQDIIHLTDLAEACVKVDWENLPTKRNPETHEWKDYSYPTSCKDYAYDRYDYGNYGGESDSLGYGDSMSDAYGDSYSDLHSNRGKKKRKRRSGKKYYDGGSGLVDMSYAYDQYEDFYEISPVSDFIKSDDSVNKVMNSDSKYDWVMSKFTDGGLEYWELQIIKDQYLNMDVAYDKFFYEYLLEKMYENGQGDII